MVEVQAQHHLRNDVDPYQPWDLKALDHVVIDVGQPVGAHRKVLVPEPRVVAEREMRQVVDDVHQDERPADLHRQRRVARGHVLLVLVTDGPRLSVEHHELHRAHDVCADGEQQHDAGPPQERGRVVEELGVLVERPRPEIDLKVAEHVADHEAEEHDAADGHDVLLADGRVGDGQRFGGHEQSRFRASHNKISARAPTHPCR